MPAALKDREEILRLLTGVFRQHGYDGATLALLSGATGLVKASLYHHFPNGKQDMARAVLARLGEVIKSEVLDYVDYQHDPREELTQLCQRLTHYFHDGKTSCLLEVFSLGQARGLFQEEIAARLQRLAGVFSRLLQAAGVAPDVADRRGWDAVAQIEGALIVSRGMGNPIFFIDMMARLPRQLLAN